MLYTTGVREGFLRNFIFGVEDSLVSTVGFVSGVASAHVERSTILLAGGILVAVEAFSMAVGSFLSDESVREWRQKGLVSAASSLAGSGVMFASYLVAGVMVLAPYALWPGRAILISILISLVLLFFLGVISARAAGLPEMFRGFRMAVIGGSAIFLGVLVAHFLPSF
jgi:VIT1/CCC1 family predicted Fe2+/Mn2+ transporter